MPTELIMIGISWLLVVAMVLALVIVVRRNRRAAPSGSDIDRERRESLLIEREERLNQLQRELESSRARLAAREADAERHERSLSEEADRLAGQLSELAQLSAEEARDAVMAAAEAAGAAEASRIITVREAEARATGEATARRILVTSMQRVAAIQAAETAVTVVALPSEDLKGRLIGKDGRNIRAFEQTTGATLVVDDSPDSVAVSCFDPQRRAIAVQTLEALIADGRVHPGRIEEAYQRCRATTDEQLHRAATAAVAEMGIIDLDPALLPILGSLTFRTSYGQNVLAHLIECGHLAATMATELGLDPVKCRRAAFLHDLGKAVVDESGSHARIGAELARQHGEHPDIVHAIEAHHNEVEPTTVEAVLTQVADAISASRPGARRDSLEAYVQRLQKLEKLAAAHAGVEQVYALQAGREVRVMVRPQDLTDAQAAALAKQIAAEVQSALTYSGNIKVTVVRETRATAMAR